LKKFFSMLVLAAFLFVGVIGCGSTPSTTPPAKAPDAPKAP